MVAREYTRGARSAGHPGAPDNEETHPRPEPTPEPNAVRAVPEPATERLAVAGERSGPPSPSLPYQEMALVHQNQNQNPTALDNPQPLWNTLHPAMPCASRITSPPSILDARSASAALTHRHPMTRLHYHFSRPLSPRGRFRTARAQRQLLRYLSREHP